MVTPPATDGNPDPNIMAAAAVAGVDRVFLVGGAQAVAALAYGTEKIPKVDKIVGPGNIFVATAKTAGRYEYSVSANRFICMIICYSSVKIHPKRCYHYCNYNCTCRSFHMCLPGLPLPVHRNQSMTNGSQHHTHTNRFHGTNPLLYSYPHF